jgi:hypothetical protein
VDRTHTFVYQRFAVTPRLMVTSPVRGCGETTLLDLLEALCVRPLKSDSITAASIYHVVDRDHPTLLIDEADNLGLAFNGALRAMLNSGHRRGGKVTRYHGGQARSFSTFAPVAVAAIGTLPLPVMHRSIAIHMERRDGQRQLTRLDTQDPDTKADLNIAYRMMAQLGESGRAEPRPANAGAVARSPSRQLAPLARHCGCVRRRLGEAGQRGRHIMGRPAPRGGCTSRRYLMRRASISTASRQAASRPLRPIGSGKRFQARALGRR